MARGTKTPGTETPVAKTARARPNVLVGALTGLIVTGVALATGHLVAALTAPESSPVIAVGQAAIDATPEWLKSFAIRTFGSNDKTALLVGIFLTLAALSVAIGIASLRRPWIGSVGIGALTIVGIAAALTRPAASAGYAVPAATAGVVASAAYAALRWASRLPERIAGVTVEPEQPTGFDRRRFLATAASLGAVAVAGGGAARLLSRGMQATADRAALGIPSPASPARPLPAGASLDLPSISPFFTPVEGFYRVDTALLVPKIRLENWRLTIGGLVDRPMTLTFQDLLSRDLIERDITLNCVSNQVGGRYIGTARWIGVRLKPLLEEAGIQPGATQIASRSVDGFTVGTPLATALDGRDSMLAIAIDGEPLPFEHGFPVRMLVPGLYGYESATKWITEIELADDTFKAYWVKRGWAKAVDVKTSSRIDTPASGDQVRVGPVEVAGVAWAQHRGIQGVQLQIDGGVWLDAVLAAEVTPDTWRQWHYAWNAEAGEHTIRVRAIDGTGSAQIAAEAPPFPSGSTGYDAIDVLAR